MVWNAAEKKDEKKTTKNKVVELHGSSETADTAVASTGRSGADLNSGMELLELSYLLSVIENTAGDDRNDVAMRKFSFNEILRREKRDQIDSHVLQVYAIDSEGLYGKDLQCQAMQELTKRTVGHKS